MVLALTFIATGGFYYYRISNRILWSVVHVSGEWQSGDAHLLEFPADDYVVLIDTGFDRYTRSDLIPYLDERGIDHINQLIITHAHRNHYGGIYSLMEHMRRIDRVYFNLPPKARCERERWPGGCDYGHVVRARDRVKASNTDLRALATDDLLYHDPDHDIILEVVYAHDGVSPPIGNTDINDTSAVLRLVYGTTTVLFTADLNRKVGSHLVENHFFLDSHIMTAPHHGVESTASNEFLEKVDPQVMIVSDSGRQWLGTRGDRIRRFAENNDIPTYVTGLHGNIAVSLASDGYSVSTETAPARPFP